jgi:ABC-type antimicrobial peptide transport system permease subunit
MTLSRLLRRSLFFHRRANFAVLLGVAVGTAVLTGALLVGDSLRGSLRDRALRQLDDCDAAMVSGRFLRQEVAQTFGDKVDPGITLRATIEPAVDSESIGRRVNGVTVWATPHNLLFRPISRDPPKRHGLIFFMPRRIDPGEVWLVPKLFESLAVPPHGKIVLRVSTPTVVPRESLLGRRGAEDTSQPLTLTVAGILAEDDPAADFSLAPGIQQPLNVFVNLDWLQQQIGEPGRVNVLMTSGHPVAELQQQLRERLTLDDWGLTIHTPKSRADDLVRRYDQNKNGQLEASEWRRHIPDIVAMAKAHPTPDFAISHDELRDYYRRRGVITLESRQLMIEPSVERAALDVAKEMNLRAMPTLVYLANSISDGKESIPYSVIGATDGTPVADEPLKDDEILLVQWPESPLKPKPGDEITLTYFDPNQEGQLKERIAKFRLRGYIPLDDSSADPDFAPEFPGITDKLGLKDWDPPFPYDNSRIGKRDEDYWAKYRTAPKAYVNLATGKRLFGSRFGDLTSIRLVPKPGSDLEATGRTFGEQLLKSLDPKQGGFVFEDVRERALRASGGGMDFGMLFLGFSIFLIAAALVLVGLLVRLALDRRASEIGLLLATGYSTRTVRRLLLKEGMIVAAIGGLLGLAGAIGYAALMLRLLVALWPEGSVGSFLTLHVAPTSLGIGYVAALVVSGVTIWWAVRALNRVAPSALLAGEVSRLGLSDSPHSRKQLRRWVIIGAAIGSMGLIVSGLYIHDAEARAGTFFTGGMLLLIAALAAVGGWLRRPTHGHVHPDSFAAIGRLGMRNAVRNPTRSLLTASLIASAAFLLVAVESFRRNPEADFGAKFGGSGGFSLIAETDLPLYRDPASPEGRQDILDALEKAYQRDPATKPKKLMDAQNLLDVTTVIPLRLKAGDDTSCLNLYQPGRPRVLGVPKSLVQRGGFRFAGTSARNAEQVANPWLLLDEPTDDGSIPVFGEQHSVQWMLKSDLGGTIEISDERGEKVRLRFVGLLQDSVFQSEILMSDASFLKLFPKSEGFSVFLLDPPAGDRHDVTSLFQTALDGRGIIVTPARERLSAYLAVENTYLSTFQVLGGFGLLLGALGLAVVLLRNVWERRGELALLRALGYRHRTLGWMVFAENAALLLLGLAAGVGSALAAVAPHVLTGEGAVPWGRLGLLLALVLIVGFAAGGSAVRSTVRAPLVPALRKE